MDKANCWEFHKCGRQPSGNKIDEYGVCYAAIDIVTNGTNGGKYGGRACWALSGTLCKGQAEGTIAKKIGCCKKCEFFKRVRKEEGDQFAVVSLEAL
ncbi:MAG: hypothetical protein UU65_C0002G0269 [candidate division CPR2 bacterium GW2011_GWC1_41_48]|uniref:Uncharacterized protein n=1 Tax=candidate division CPR2 bacterium GW2011_GWC1_41_48 TaxID=1618344 RepID=A0A0G0YIW2_UNCC2|nr:MAG: hypothetical protein UT47_C0002G0035 [candidate division CPR2 bacterium GW2011_GWC2_39_35]KKR27659.1 MAG: hypothetical protein UT59_C0049G0006 [candidate division CPR2 bacterium GW2011_GWD1_39_7]KKR28994.1 MAG: hypothetical protein UT60_C0008G0037 [candidate division CPR2 bacterium GW2011_GWD2_39_7]KKS09491.1 MAG: hypothetical protein UU65_C0002G0269 [candidate division CPR2 bacterium GW2011_GWC1_41_48]OGB59529.1 MAG: hypothetical protein A2Y27_01740 [candidate division CPR2 bacterium G